MRHSRSRWTLAILVAGIMASLLPTGSSVPAAIRPEASARASAHVDGSGDGHHWWSGWHLFDDRRHRDQDDGNARAGLDAVDALNAASNAAKAASPGSAATDDSAVMIRPTKAGRPWIHIDHRRPADGVDASSQSLDALYEASGIAPSTEPHRSEAPGNSPAVAKVTAAGTASTPPGTPVAPGLSAHVRPSCTGTGTDGSRVQVVYVRETGQTDRFAAVLPLLEDYVARIDDAFALSSAQTGGGRRVRWVQTATCEPDIRQVVLPTGSLGSSASATFSAARNAGLNAANRKYLLFAEGYNLNNGASCGVGEFYPDTAATGNWNDGRAALIARVDCWSGTTASHELMHTLGAVQRDAPHATTAGHCTDATEIMCYNDGTGTVSKVCASGNAWFYDCNHDDYFSTGAPTGSYLATHWDTGRSSFLDSVEPLAAAPRITVATDKASLLSGDTATVTASATQSLSYTWEVSPQSSAGTRGCSLDTSVGATVHVACQAIGTRNVTVTVTGLDAAHSTATAATTLAVSNRAAPTVTVTGPPRAEAGTSLTYSAAAVGQGPFAYAWSLPTGGCAFAGRTDQASVSLTCPTAAVGSLLGLRLSATQADLQAVAWTSATTQVVAPLAGQPVVDVSGGSDITAGRSASFSGTASGFPADDPVARWSWSVDRDCLMAGGGTSTVTVRCDAAVAGTLRLTLTATSTSGNLVRSASKSVTVGPPTAVTVAVAPDRTSVTAGESTVLRSSVTDTSGGLRSTSVLEQSTDGRQTWTAIAGPVTTPEGAMAVPVSPGRTTVYRVRVIGLANATATTTVEVVPIGTTTTVAARQSGATLTLTGVLSDTGSGLPVPDASVSVQVRWYGATSWSTLGSTTSSSAGTLTYAYRMSTRAGTFRFRYAGVPGRYAPAAAASVFVKAPTRVTATVRQGSPDTLTGVAATSSGTRLGHASLRLERETSTGAWVGVATYQASSTGVAVATTRPGRRTYYRWVLPSSPTRNRAVSGTMMVYR